MSTDVQRGSLEDDVLTIQSTKEHPMYQITSTIVEERQNDLRTEAKRFHLSRIARRVTGTAKPRSW